MNEKEIQKAIRRTIETGKVVLGYKRSLNLSLKGGAKLIIVAGNSPQTLKDQIENNCSKTKTPCKEVSFTSLEVGSFCGKPYPVSLLSVIEEGNSEILKITE